MSTGDSKTRKRPFPLRLGFTQLPPTRVICRIFFVKVEYTKSCRPDIGDGVPSQAFAESAHRSPSASNATKNSMNWPLREMEGLRALCGPNVIWLNPGTPA